MIKNFVKNSIITVTLSGIVFSPLNNLVFAQSAEGISTQAGAEAAATAAQGTKIGQTAAVLIPTLIYLGGIANAECAAKEAAGTIVAPVLGTSGIFAVCRELSGIGLGAIGAEVAINTSISAGNDLGETIRAKGALMKNIIEFAKKIAYVLFKRVILDRLVDALIQWINHGGQGGIIESWDQFLQESGEAAVGEFAKGLGAGFLCSNFGLNAQFILLPVEKFSKVTCTLDQIVGNINNFMENFQNGGWLAYQETWHPRNNFYGATLIAIDEARKAEAEAKDAAQNKGIAGKGFLSFEKCDLYADNLRGNLDAKGNPIRPNYTGVKYVKECRVVTPGTVAAEAAVGAIVTTPLTRLIHADDLSLYLTAIVDASINQLSIAAIDGLRGLVSKNTSHLKVNPVFPCAGLTGEAFRACVNSVNAERQEFKFTQDNARGAAVGTLGTRTDIANTLNQAINLQTSYVEALERLIVLGRGAGREQELADEQLVLDGLNDRFENNQVTLEALTAQDNKISGIELSNGITPEDWIKLGTSVNTQFIGDSVDSSSELNQAKQELGKIQDKVNAKLPGILSQLPSGQ